MSISAEYERYIGTALSTGRYETADALVAEALTRRRETDLADQQLVSLRKKNDEGYAQALRCDSIDSERSQPRSLRLDERVVGHASRRPGHRRDLGRARARSCPRVPPGSTLGFE